MPFSLSRLEAEKGLKLCLYGSFWRHRGLGDLTELFYLFLCSALIPILFGLIIELHNAQRIPPAMLF